MWWTWNLQLPGCIDMHSLISILCHSIFLFLFCCVRSVFVWVYQHGTSWFDNVYCGFSLWAQSLVVFWRSHSLANLDARFVLKCWKVKLFFIFSLNVLCFFITASTLTKTPVTVLSFHMKRLLSILPLQNILSASTTSPANMLTIWSKSHLMLSINAPLWLFFAER